jgi:NAD(P)H-dependent flavin oxidoreductase YrpB (nitropropane dioxygenase family)
MRFEGGIATLGLEGTLPRARRRGCHRALLERRLADAAAAGCDAVQAFACEGGGHDSAAAEHSLRGLGFEQAGEVVHWRRPVGLADD